MSVFVLPIKHSYVSSWGVWEAVREIMQNGLDEQDQYRHELVVSHKDGVLSVKNFGANLDAKALLIGHTTKTGTELRGQHGEGLNLAMLSASRAGRKMRIETPDEIWTPSLNYSPEYQERVLHVNIRKRRKPSDCVEVLIDVTQQEWEMYKNNFIYLLDIEEECIIKTYRGDIFLEKEFQGRIYVKGIFVEKDADLKYGYDLKEVTLDRDRRVLSAFDKRWEIQNIFSTASATSPQKIGKLVFDLLANDWEDARGVNLYSGDALKEAIADRFKEEHGEDAIPVQSIGDSAEMGHFGKRGIVVPQAMRSVLEKTAIQTPIQVKESFAKAVIKQYSFDELEEIEKETLSRLEKLFLDVYEAIPQEGSPLEDFSTKYGVPLRIVLAIPMNILNTIEIAELFDKRTRGLCNIESGTITISKDILKNYNLTLRVVVHELAHKIDGSSDGYKGHVASMEDIWSLLFAIKAQK